MQLVLDNHYDIWFYSGYVVDQLEKSVFAADVDEL